MRLLAKTFHHISAQWSAGPPEVTDMANLMREDLPPDLQEWVEREIVYGGRIYRPDYLSPRFCIEIKRITGNRMDLSARTGMQQLLVYKAALARGNDDMPSFVLMLILDQASAMGGKSIARITDEATLLGIEVRYCNHPHAAILTIEGLELGTAPDFEELISDDF